MPSSSPACRVPKNLLAIGTRKRCTAQESEREHIRESIRDYTVRHVNRFGRKHKQKMDYAQIVEEKFMKLVKKLTS